MKLKRDYIILLVISILAAYFYFTPDVGGIIKLLLQSFVVITVILWICSILKQTTKPLRSRLFAASPGAVQRDNFAVIQQMHDVRQQSQLTFQVQAAEYVEKVVIPRKDARRKEKEMKWSRLLGTSFTSKGHVLQDESSADKALGLKQTDQPVAKQLPEEPLAGESGVITIALKTPQNTIHKRRFCITDSVELLLFYMESIGYSRTVYSLLLSFPRICISDKADNSLEQCGITTDTAVIVDEI